ncbi:LPS assembly lipoprotein LptE [Bythopirellula polymerisocia]|uniref:Lipopolysaccharide-assembly n=1 Tax=Bythopirellula polymerisocia TaxID=2528003 RepID=A0A5C6CY94_9BACT|nr:LPS assembly lipoprotein LptE [Bythopirellula polymerisocia]TWU28517.1 hypothetical protein Pla144_18070 [Bythopirellula polymerisocia]
MAIQSSARLCWCSPHGRFFSLLLCILSSNGCASYRMGAESLYAPDVQTVYVPMIESDSFRRDLGERLTEAVVKEIELKSPFKVVGTPDADSILAVRLVSDTKRVTVENRNDDPRALEINMLAEITWINRRREPLRLPSTVPLPPELLPINQTATQITAAGQSTASTSQQAIERLAQQIVSTMEEGW